MDWEIKGGHPSQSFSPPNKSTSASITQPKVASIEEAHQSNWEFTTLFNQSRLVAKTDAAIKIVALWTHCVLGTVSRAVPTRTCTRVCVMDHTI